MCRLLLLTGLQRPELTAKFMEYAKVPMSYGNNMGIGYTAVKSDGEFFTERWHNNSQFFDRETVMTKEVIEQLQPFKARLGNLTENYSLYGQAPDFSDVTSVTMHTRYATCGKEFENTHPFVYGDTSLVHNGVIDNAFQLDLNKISTCDSEAALQSYIKHGVAGNIENAQAWIDSLSGYWAFGIFARDASGRRVLDIIRNNASLYVSNIEGFGVAIATTADIITSSAARLSLNAPSPQLVKSNVLWRFDATTGVCLDKIELSDSKLNAAPRWGWSQKDEEEWEKITGEKKTSEVKLSVVPRSPEGAGTDDAHSEFIKFFDEVEDTESPLIDRLYMYDEFSNSNFGYWFETLPVEMRQASWQYDDFYDVLAEIEMAYGFYTEGAIKS